MRKGLSVTLIAVVLAALFPWLSAAADSDQPRNLIKNGSFDEWTTWGTQVVGLYWGTYLIRGSVEYGHNEWDGGGQQIRSNGADFEAALYQEVSGVTPGATYYGYVGTGAKWGPVGSPRQDGHIMRTIGIDPFGGTDPRSPNVVWGSQVWDDNVWDDKDDPNANAPQVWAVAKGTKITLFLKAMYEAPGLDAHVWFKDAGLQLDPSKPAQQLQPSGTSTPMPVSKPVRPEADYDVANGRFFTQGSGQPGTGRGFAVTDDGGIPLWSEYQRLGGYNALGPAISRRFLWNGYVVQVMQKVVFQWRPEVGQVYFVNIFDEMSKAGKDDWLLNVRSIPKPADSSADAGLAWPQIVSRHVDIMNPNPAIKAVYNADSDPINHFGLPLSLVDYGNVVVVRTQRAVLQQWKTDVAWAKAGQVTIANGGDVAKEAAMFGADLLAPEDPPA